MANTASFKALHLPALSVLELQRDQEIRARRRFIQSVYGQDVVPPLQDLLEIGDGDTLEVDGCRIVVQSGGGRVPHGLAHEVPPGDLSAVEIGDEPIVVTDPQRQTGHIIDGVPDHECHADVATGLGSVHRGFHVTRNVAVVAGAYLVSHAAGTACCERPRGIVERCAASPCVHDRSAGDKHPFRGILGH
jgi:hypothetical protein